MLLTLDQSVALVPAPSIDLLLLHPASLEEASGDLINEFLELSTLTDAALARALHVTNQSSGPIEPLEADGAGEETAQVGEQDVLLNIGRRVVAGVVVLTCWEWAAVLLEHGIPKSLDVVALGILVPEA